MRKEEDGRGWESANDDRRKRNERDLATLENGTKQERKITKKRKENK